MAEPAGSGPLDPALLAAAGQGAPARPFPWRPFALLLLPVASAAAGVGLQYLLEGAHPEGDFLWRWLLWSCAAGVGLGALAGAYLARSAARRLAWTLFGAAAPFALTGLVAFAARAVRPVREVAAARAQARCRESRRVCSAREFSAACAAAGKPGPAALSRATALLGAPAQQLCDAAGCTFRFTYAGPWTPDDYVASLLCSVVADGSGRGVRSALVPGSGSAN